MAIDSYVTRSRSAETADFDWGTIEWFDGSDRTDGEGLTVGRVTFDPGASNSTHRHPNCEEALLLLSGRLEHSLGEEETVLEPGDLLHIPQDVPHSATNLVDDEAVALIAYDTADRQVDLLD